MTNLRHYFTDTDTVIPHILMSNTRNEGSRKITELTAELTGIEKMAFFYLFEGFGESRTTTTLGIEEPDAKKLYAGIYQKLGIKSPKEIFKFRAIHMNAKIADEFFKKGIFYKEPG